MDEYISREEIVRVIKSRIAVADDAWETGYNTAMAEMMQWIKHIPAADVEPVRHGRWIKTNPYQYKCSSCGARVWIKLYPLEEHKFCWHCGAKMDGGEQE